MSELLTLPWETLTDRSVVAVRMSAWAAREIIEGRYEPGALVTEADLASEFGASRTPAREAMLQLERWRLVRLVPKKGAIVTTVSAAQRRDLLAVRAMFESDAISSVHGDPEGLAALAADLRTLLSLQREALEKRDPLAFASVDYAFHARIIAAGGNGVVAGLLETLGPRLARLTFDTVIEHPDALDAFWRDHDELTRLAGEGRADEFAAVVRRHIRSGHGLSADSL